MRKRHIRRNRAWKKIHAPTSLTPNGRAKWKTGSKLERDVMFEVGMCCLASISEPSERHTCDEIADFTGCSRQRIQQIEGRALRKLRAALYRDKGIELELKEFLNTNRIYVA
jgi:hypothetical protein